MPSVQNGYITVPELKMALDPTGQAKWTPNDDLTMAMAIEATSRWVDIQKKTQFFITAGEARYRTPRFHDKIWLDDFTAITSILLDEDGDGTYEATMAPGDYQIGPRNAVAKGRPYRWVRIKADGDYSFPVGVEDGVKVTADWGYNTGASETGAPGPIRQACLLMSMRIYKRKDAIFGVAGSPSVGGVQIIQAKITADVDIMTLLNGVVGKSHG